MEITDYREVMVSGRYQAQLVCPGCKGWILTENLEVHRIKVGKGDHATYPMVAECFDVICTSKSAGSPPCGEELGDVILRNWKYSTPVKWAEKRLQESGNEKSGKD